MNSNPIITARGRRQSSSPRLGAQFSRILTISAWFALDIVAARESRGLSRDATRTPFQIVHHHARMEKVPLESRPSRCRIAPADDRMMVAASRCLPEPRVALSTCIQHTEAPSPPSSLLSGLFCLNRGSSPTVLSLQPCFLLALLPVSKLLV